jgi:hypothetical protein
MEEKIKVVWPSGKCAQPRRPLAPRLDSIEGKTICALYNGVFHFEETWPLIQELLSMKYPTTRYVGWEEFGTFIGKEEGPLLDVLAAKLKLRGCDAVVSGRGC